MKTQMKFQKRLCFTLLILGALSVVFGLGYTTGVIAAFGKTLDRSGSRGYIPDSRFESGGQLYLDMQWFCNLLFYLGIVLLLAAVVLYITATNTRRNYYVSNYIATILVAAVFIVISVIVLILNASYLSQTLAIINDEAAMQGFLEMVNDETTAGTYTYSTNITMFIVGFVLYIVNIIAAVALILNLVWKNKLMKGEKALLAQGIAKEVA